jgi:hypothetical protein
MDEPRKGSVVLVHGPGGTAYQRFYLDGLWYRGGSRDGFSWDLLVVLNPVLIHEGEAE